jgi:hypothetical protein
MENPDLADQWNTVIKMACKRALVAGALNATGASDVFTQDVEDQPDAGEGTPFEGGAADGTERATADQAHAAAEEPVRQEPQAQAVPEWLPPNYTPRWPSVSKALEELGTYDASYQWATLFVAASKSLLNVEVARFADLQPEQKREVWLRLNLTYDNLLEACGEFPPPTREDVQRAFAKAWGGIVVEIDAEQGYSDAEKQLLIDKVGKGAPAAEGDAAGDEPAGEAALSNEQSEQMKAAEAEAQAEIEFGNQAAGS